MKYIYSIILSTCAVLCIKAQAPQGFNYQGVARNASGVELPNQSIGVQLSVLDGSPSGTVLYTETHALLTDANGLFTLTIGLGSPTFATFSAINWATGGSKWLKVSLDATGGSSYQLMGTSQLLSVPYALFAGNVANNGGKQTLVLSDDITDSQAAALIAAEVGPNTQEIKIVGTTNLTTVNLSMITTAINIEVSNNSALTSVNFSGLTRCDGSLIFQNSPSLTTINLSSLVKVTTGTVDFINTGLTTLNYPSITKINGNINIKDNLNLTGINLSGVTTTESIYIENNTALNSIAFSGLTNCSSNIYINTNASLSGINFPALSTCGSISVSNNSVLSSASFPALSMCNKNQIAVNYNPALSSFSLPALTSTEGISINNNSILTTISLPNVTLCNNQFYVTNNASLNSFSAPMLAAATNVNISFNSVLSSLNLNSLAISGGWLFSFNNNSLTSLSLPALNSFNGQFEAGNNKLTVSVINSLLNKLVSINPSLTGKQIYLNNQNPLAPPSGQGVTDKNTLIANGNTVITD